MFRKLLSFCGAALLAGTVIGVTAGPGRAAGPYPTPTYNGSYNSGGSRPNPSPYRDYARNNSYSYRYNNYPYYYDQGNGPYGPYYNSYLNSPYSSSGSSYYESYYDPDERPRRYPDGFYAGAVRPDARGTYGSAASAAPQPADYTARITVRVPAGAEVWFDDNKTTTTGTVRRFQSPPLSHGERYAYDIRARWQENGREVTQTRKVTVTAGSLADIGFPLPPDQNGK